MANFLRPLRPSASDGYIQSADGALTAMTISGSGRHFVVLWGGDSNGKELTLVAADASGDRFVSITRIGLERGHRVDSDGDYLWYILYEITAPSAGTGTLTAVDATGMPFARIQLIVNKGNPKSAVILIPSQGKDTNSFMSVAINLSKDV